MTQLEQLRVIVAKEIKTKQWLAEQQSNSVKTRYYFAGGLAALHYVKHIIDRLINETGR
jgi:hypothetical protein